MHKKQKAKKTAGSTVTIQSDYCCPMHPEAVRNAPVTVSANGFDPFKERANEKGSDERLQV
jgi:hypothetical protein